MRVGRLTVSYDFIANAIGLPPGNQITAVVPQTAEDVTHRTVGLIIAGDNMPITYEGETIPIVRLPLES